MKRLLLTAVFILAACEAPITDTRQATPGVRAAVGGNGSCVVNGVTYARGYDQYGYNRCASMFNGTGESWSLAKGLPADYLGIYANDKLIMNWNAAWDACNAHGYDDATYCAGAWDTNEWNGRFPGGSGSVWHYKTIWVGSLGEASPYFVPGGYIIWGNYETIMDQGMDPNIGPGHLWFAHATPNGL